MIAKILEILRILGAAIGFFIAYNRWHTPIAAIHVLVPWLIISLAGLTGIGSIFFSKETEKSLGWQGQSPFHKEVGYFNIACAVIALIVYLFNWGIHAELTILFTYVLFIIFSAVNHAKEILYKKNYAWQNAIRPILTFLLVAWLLPLLIVALIA